MLRAETECSLQSGPSGLISAYLCAHQLHLGPVTERSTAGNCPTTLFWLSLDALRLWKSRPALSPHGPEDVSSWRYLPSKRVKAGGGDGRVSFLRGVGVVLEIRKESRLRTSYGQEPADYTQAGRVSEKKDFNHFDALFHMCVRRIRMQATRQKENISDKRFVWFSDL